MSSVHATFRTIQSFFNGMGGAEFAHVLVGCETSTGLPVLKEDTQYNVSSGAAQQTLAAEGNLPGSPLSCGGDQHG